MLRALLFDIGEVISPEQWPLLDAAEERTGRTLVGRGPLDPDGDPVWQRYLRGELSFTGYWAEYARVNGYDDWRLLFRDLTPDMSGDDFAHPAAAALIRDAQASGLKVGTLTNDGVGINGREFFSAVPVLAGLDAFVNARDHGGGKPAPEAYLGAADELGVAPDEIVFLDDMTMCIDGARAVGMTAVLVDPIDRDVAFDRVRELLGLGVVSDAQRLVTTAEAAYAAQDVGRIMALFDPDISIHWNGRRVAHGLDEARRFHEQQLGFGSGLRDFHLTKRLRATHGDTIAVEYESTFRRSDGSLEQSVAGEFWTLRRGLLVEWHCYEHRLGE